MSPASRYRPPTPRAHARRALVNAVNLTTPLGLAVARLGRAQVRRGPDGLWLAEGYTLRFPVAGAFTIGNVVTTAHSFDELECRCPGVLGHEGRHADQYAQWGLAFFPLYLAAASVSYLRYGDPAVGNHFERQAGLVSGSYLSPGVRPRPRSWTEALNALRRWPRPRGGGRNGSAGAASAAGGDA